MFYDVLSSESCGLVLFSWTGTHSQHRDELDLSCVFIGCPSCLPADLHMFGRRRVEMGGWGREGGVTVADTNVRTPPPSETERPTFSHQTLSYINPPPPPHRPACCLLLGNKPRSPVAEPRWAAAAPESVQMGQWGQKEREELGRKKERKRGIHVFPQLHVGAEKNNREDFL